MRINIFGVGRSGTKAVQLWLSYLVAQKYGDVLVNYEPLRYQSKSLGPNHWGWRIHRSLPLLTAENEIADKSLREFGKALTRHPFVVSKFIRGTGRINLINSLTKPNLSILVVRDLYQVLQSVGRLTWNLFDNEKDWLRLHEQGIEISPLYKKYAKKLSKYDKLSTNAAYWFLMNKHALDGLKDTIVVDYKDLTALEKHAQRASLEPEGSSLRDAMFKGGRIHRDSPLEEVERRETGMLSRLAEFTIPSKLRVEVNSRFVRRAPGSICRVNVDVPWISKKPEKTNSIRPEMRVQPNPFFDQMAQQVNEAVAAALARQNSDE